VKAGVRALGVAESYREPEGDAKAESAVQSARSVRSTLAGAVVRADRVVDGFAFESCTVGGTDATDAVAALVSALGREDIRYLLIAGIAPAWFNLLDLPALREQVEVPVLSVSFETSEGLEPALREQFSEAALAERLAIYRRQPPRRSLEVNGERVFVRAVGCDRPTAREVIAGFTPEGGRPEPVRVARLAARGANGWRRRRRRESE
jgi:endonuclease V-like protein UPF0215 family